MNADKFHTLNRENYYHDLSSNQIVHEKDTTEADNGLGLIAIAAIALIGISIYFVRLGAAHASRSRFRKVSGFPKAFKSSTQTKCTNCRFFDSNSYLKCAVHPTKVLKKEAQECLDYEAARTKKDRRI